MKKTKAEMTKTEVKKPKSTKLKPAKSLDAVRNLLTIKFDG